MKIKNPKKKHVRKVNEFFYDCEKLEFEEIKTCKPCISILRKIRNQKVQTYPINKKKIEEICC